MCLTLIGSSRGVQRIQEDSPRDFYRHLCWRTPNRRGGTFEGIVNRTFCFLNRFANERIYRKYNKAGTTYLFDLDFHHLKEGPEEEWTNLYTVDAYHAGNVGRLSFSAKPQSFFADFSSCSLLDFWWVQICYLILTAFTKKHTESFL